MASPSEERAVACSFVVEHSELFKEQKAGDEAATVEGCFPAPETIATEKVVPCLAALARLLKEMEAAAFSKVHTRRSRLFWVRDGPLFESLKGLDNEKSLADLKTVADYMLLPKSLVEALELEAAVVKARREYREAIGAYNLLTATDPKPRLMDFLVKDASLRAIMRKVFALPQIQTQKWLEAALPGSGFWSSRPYGAGDAVLRAAFHDGLTGESLCEYGFTPSAHRMLAYASGCVIARRPVPPEILAARPVATTSYDTSVELMSIATGVLGLAVEAGNLEALQQFHANGWDFADRYEQLVTTAAVTGGREVLKWLYSLDPSGFLPITLTLFGVALGEGHLDTAKWMLEAFDVFRVSSVSAELLSEFTVDAARGNNLDAVRWLHEELGAKVHREVAYHACRHGNKDMLEYLFSKTTEAVCWRWRAFRAGLLAGRLDMSLALLERGRPQERFSPDILAVACEGFKGDTSVLDTLLSTRPPVTASVSTCYPHMLHAASEHGDPHVLDWIVKQPGMKDLLRDPDDWEFRRSLSFAVAAVHTETVRWLLRRTSREALVRLATQPRISATLLGDLKHNRMPTLDLLQLLAPYYKISCYYEVAMRAMNLDLVRVLRGLGAQKSYSGLENLLATAGRWVPSSVLPFLRGLAAELGRLDDFAKPDTGCTWAARGGSVEIITFMMEQGGTLSADALKEAARYGQLPMCRWLRQQGVKWPKGIVYQALQTGANEVADWVKAEQAKG